jgi:hypothetical protein
VFRHIHYLLKDVLFFTLSSYVGYLSIVMGLHHDLIIFGAKFIFLLDNLIESSILLIVEVNFLGTYFYRILVRNDAISGED